MQGSFKIDLHTHSREGSSCSQTSLLDMAQSACDAGLHGIALTNHNKYLPKELVNSLRTAFPNLKLYNAIEVTVEDEDIVCLGEPDLDLYTDGKWDQTAAGLIKRMRERGNFTILAHPYRYRDNLPDGIENIPPDGIEIRSCHIGFGITPRIEQFVAAHPSVKRFGSSDAHGADLTGLFFSVLPELPDSESSLANLLHRITPAYGYHPQRLASYNQLVETREKPIRDYIASGNDSPEDFTERFHLWRGYYDALKSNRSYHIEP